MTIDIKHKKLDADMKTLKKRFSLLSSQKLFFTKKLCFSAIDKFKYKPHYGTDFGGVTAITPEQYKKANGHSNQFWGWGGEDNDMEYRIRSKYYILNKIYFIQRFCLL